MYQITNSITRKIGLLKLHPIIWFEKYLYDFNLNYTQLHTSTLCIFVYSITFLNLVYDV